VSPRFLLNGQWVRLSWICAVLRGLFARQTVPTHFTAHFCLFRGLPAGAVVVLQRLNEVAPKVGLEPTTDRLTADCSTIELLWIPKERAIYKASARASTDFPTLELPIWVMSSQWVVR
jgi:hypothetical protein